jgi:hypothetical protein
VANKYLDHPYYGRIEGVPKKNDLPHAVVFVSDAVSLSNMSISKIKYTGSIA